MPSGSWNVVIRVDNPEIQEKLLTGELGGLSLNNRIAPRCKGNLTGIVRYQDVADAECIVPLYISFVESGANGYGLHVYDYDAYILKSKNIKPNGGKRMDFNNFLNGLKSLIKEAEAESVIENEDVKPEEEVVDETTEETNETVESEEDEAEIKKEDTVDETTNNDNERIIDLENRIKTLEDFIKEKYPEEESSEETEDETEEPVDEDTPKITKSEKVIIPDNPVESKNYYEMTGRDPETGIKIRK